MRPGRHAAEPVQLLGERPVLPGRLLLQRGELGAQSQPVDHLDGAGRPQRADQLVLEVGLADEEAVCRQVARIPDREPDLGQGPLDEAHSPASQSPEDGRARPVGERPMQTAPDIGDTAEVDQLHPGEVRTSSPARARTAATSLAPSRRTTVDTGSGTGDSQPRRAHPSTGGP